jgi:hypothetical protein
MTNFMDLPAEILLMVCDHLWQYTPKINIQARGDHDIGVLLHYKYPTNHHVSRWIKLHGTAFPRWLFTCKTLLREGLDQLNLRGYMEITPGGSGLYAASDFSRLSSPHPRARLST